MDRDAHEPSTDIALVKLIGQRSVNRQNRARFFAIAAHVMGRILLDHARRRQREKRGGGELPVQRGWAAAKVWVYRALTSGPEGRHA
jgi:ECF sigma factor